MKLLSLFTFFVIMLWSLTITDTVDNSPVWNNLKMKMGKPSTVNKEYALTIWKAMETKSQETAQFIVNKIGGTVLEFLRNTNISNPCVSSITSLLKGFVKTKKWAVKMIDASGKVPEGIVTGTVTSFGSYDECINIKTNAEHNTSGFRGQYCTLRFQPVLPPRPRFQSIVKRLDMFTNFTSSDKIFSILSRDAQYFSYLSFRIGICLPSTCPVEDIQKLSDRVATWMYLSSKTVHCEEKEEMKLDTHQIIVGVVLLLVCLFILVSTTIDICLRKTKEKTEFTGIFSKRTSLEYFLAFSLYTNSKKLFSTKSSARTIGALHGIRLISILWIIWGHLYFYINYQGFTDSFGATNFVASFLSQPLMNGTVAVDTFFFLSGLLTFYVTLELVEKNHERLNIVIYVVHRYWRLAPPLAFTICFTMLIPLLGSGPLWHESIDHVVKGCQKHWWTNLLFINNFVSTKDVCLNYSWYLANDFQFHILSLLILLPLLKSVVRGFIVTAMLTLVSMVITGGITYFYNYPATRLYGILNGDDIWEFCTRIYFQPYTHLGAYCVGVTLGCIISKKQKIRLSALQQAIGWMLTATGLLLVLYGTYNWNRGYESTHTSVILYAATHRTVWALAIAWLTMTCVYGYGGFLNTFLSWKFLMLLDRVTFAAYLLHPLVQQVYYSRNRVHLPNDHYFMTYIYFGTLMVVYPAAFVFTLFFESPFLAIEKLMLRTRTEKRGIEELN
ncbi:nose resistant to fluoxetine protein 6-like [Tachypleus tridentatus]|uniref:nose resistant to fluoxetine protein 6-like n=1 Tax=Tachypleus tridentatus TaxID=6853 RepID=UPI003FD5562A